jgi:hypothetical protein
MSEGKAIAVTADGQVVAAGKDAIYLGAHLAGGSANSTLKLYHGTSASDPLIASLAAVIGAGDDDSTKGCGVPCPNGIFADIGGTGAEAIVVIG